MGEQPLLADGFRPLRLPHPFGSSRMPAVGIARGCPGWESCGRDKS
jgi:hypothetical protein